MLMAAHSAQQYYLERTIVKIFDTFFNEQHPPYARQTGATSEAFSWATFVFIDKFVQFDLALYLYGLCFFQYLLQ